MSEQRHDSSDPHEHAPRMWRASRAARRRFRAAVGLVLALASSAGIARAEPLRAESPRDERPVLRVLAAASLTEVVAALAQDFGAARVETSFGASSDLARQIADGAPADVFIAASTDWTEFLAEAKATIGEARIVARNALVCIAPQSGRLALVAAKDPIRDPAALLARLAPGELVAIADPGVPAGEYARAVLGKLGIARAFEARLVGQKDVRSVLHAVEQGEVEAGFVYATDARIARVVTLFAFDRAALAPIDLPPIELPAVVVRQSENPALARRFLDFLGSEPARARLSTAGFVLP
jgi:molybdate transport system substrate-binding protein